MTEHVVPFTPAFYHASTQVVGLPGYIWGGLSPYIDTADADASWGEIDLSVTGDAGGQWVAAQFPAFAAPAGITGARVDCQIRPAGAGTLRWALVSIGVDAPYYDWGVSRSLVDGWNTVADDYTFNPAFGPDYDLPRLLEALAAGTLVLIAHEISLTATFRVSQLRLTLVGEAVPICQQLQRRDGLGRGGVPLARGQATRQTSNQARVTY